MMFCVDAGPDLLGQFSVADIYKMEHKCLNIQTQLSSLYRAMWPSSCRKIFCFLITLTILLNVYLDLDSQMSASSCDDDQFQCWFEKKQQLNKNIDRVCRKYGDSINTPVRASLKEELKRKVLHYENLVYCIIEKVRMKITFTFLLTLAGRIDHLDCRIC